jgi:hypothetical protein
MKHINIIISILLFEFFLFAIKYIGKNIIAELWNEKATRSITQNLKNFLSIIYFIDSPIIAAANICRRYVNEKKKTKAINKIDAK